MYYVHNFPSNYVGEIPAWVILLPFQSEMQPCASKLAVKQSQYLPIAELDTSNYYVLLWKV